VFYLYQKRFLKERIHMTGTQKADTVIKLTDNTLSEASEDNQLIYLPKPLVEKYIEFFTHILPYHGSVISVHIGVPVPLKVPVYAVYRSEINALNMHLESAQGDTIEFIPAKVVSPTDEMRLVYGLFRGVESHFNAETDEDSLVDELTDYATVISSLTNRAVSFEGSRRAGCMPPPSPHMLRFILNPPATFDRERCKESALFGLSLHRVLDHEVTYAGPFVGRGVVHKAPGGAPVAQTIAGVTHLFYPVEHCHHKEAITILVSAMVVALNDAVSNAPQSYSHTEVHKDNAALLLETESDTMLSKTLEALTSCEQDIELRKKRLLESMRELTTLRALTTVYAHHQKKGVQEIECEVQALKNIPGVSLVCMVSGALELHSKDVVVMHQGVRYQLGTYALRITTDFSPVVYAHTTYHPNGVAHPHIGPSGAVCFGNITYALIEAASEYNRVRVAELVFGWLFDGYDEAIAETPITEWPEEKKEGETLDAVAA
jgi:hypothetical protein